MSNTDNVKKLNAIFQATGYLTPNQQLQSYDHGAYDKVILQIANLNPFRSPSGEVIAYTKLGYEYRLMDRAALEDLLS